jgi:hypothetical protein
VRAKGVKVIVALLVGCVISLLLIVDFFLGHAWLLRQRRENDQTIFAASECGYDHMAGRQSTTADVGMAAEE